MFFNLTPYLSWLGIMFTSKPNDLQNRLNILNNPAPSIIPSTTENPPTKITETTTIPLTDYFICSGKAAGRYPHPTDCSKYFECSGKSEIVRPTLCPKELHFSPNIHVCTLPQDAGCRIPDTTQPPDGSDSTPSTWTTPILPGSDWITQLERSNYHKALDSERLVIYYDHSVVNPTSILWPIAFTRTMWDSIIMMYGNYGPGNRLYLVLRGKLLPSDVNYSTYLDSTRGHVNGIEVGSLDWSVENSTNTDLITRNIAQIVAKYSKGIHYDGAEPGWIEIFVYDLYQRVGRSQDMARWESHVIQTENNNIDIIPMFSQWYLVIYRMYGGGPVLNRFLILREQNFPKSSTDNTTFARNMNRGEFVHFWSGGSGTNLTALATTVFGWSTALNEQYQKALLDFRALSY